jgi:SSS family solute:Na+ symporter
LVGLFTRRAPAIGAKLVIIFHVIAYGLLKFAFDDVVTLHFLHLYAILFFIELAIMTIAAKLAPRTIPPARIIPHEVDLQPRRYARPVAFLLMALVVGKYVLFSPLGLA